MEMFSKENTFVGMKIKDMFSAIYNRQNVKLHSCGLQMQSLIPCPGVGALLNLSVKEVDN